MQFPFWRVWELGRGGGKHWGVSCFHSAFLLMTHSICCDNSALCQEYFTFKVQQKCSAWQMTASKPKKSWVVVILCDQRSVFDCVLDYHPLFSGKKNAAELAHAPKSFLQALFPATKHQSTSMLSPSVLWGCSHLFSSVARKIIFYFPPRYSEFQMTLA